MNASADRLQMRWYKEIDYEIRRTAWSAVTDQISDGGKDRKEKIR
jgi:hypothetical protein